MKAFFSYCALAAMMFGMWGCCGQEPVLRGENYTFKDGLIVVDEPERAPGQESVLGLAVDPIPVVRVAVIGLGRGMDAVNRMSNIDGVEIKVLCDLNGRRIKGAQGILGRRNMPKADEYTGENDWKKICERDDIDLVYIATPWELHVPMAVYAMENGKHAAVEVPAALTIADCWKLVDTAEKTRRHCMMLENCCYDFFEMATLNMAQQGLFGEILHVEGAYIHNLYDHWRTYKDENWRVKANQELRGDLYPTHGLGPICQVLNIHRGDKMEYLVSVDTKSVNGMELAGNIGLDEFANGDHTVTLIRTHNGKSIEVQHNVMTPRPYDRLYQLTGTKGFANKYPIEGYTLDPEHVSPEAVPDYKKISVHGFLTGEDKDALMEKYKHPIHVEIGEKARKIGGHGGMDFTMDYRLIYCLQNGLPLDQDVYDAAEWSCLAELTAISLENNSMPVKVPDFTRGDWNKLDGLKFAE